MLALHRVCVVVGPSQSTFKGFGPIMTALLIWLSVSLVSAAGVMFFIARAPKIEDDDEDFGPPPIRSPHFDSKPGSRPDDGESSTSLKRQRPR